MVLLWFCLIACGGAMIYNWHAPFFDISREHFELAHYYGMVFMKVGAFGLFFFPYVRVRLASRARRQ